MPIGHAEWAVFAPGLKTLEDASHLRSQILSASEMAELVTRPGRASSVSDPRGHRSRAYRS
jgi:NADH:ubiquinone reductase (H+-translocating)